MKKSSINWNGVSAIGQLLSGLGVALTLVYLTLQVRHAEIAASDANRLARTNGVVNFFLASAHDPDFRQTSLRMRKKTALIDEIGRRLEITQEEATHLESVALYWFWLHWGQWNTTNEAKDLIEIKNMVRRFYTQPHIRLMWEAHIGWMDPLFEDFVNEVLAEADADPAFDRREVDVEKLSRRLDELGIGLPGNRDEVRDASKTGSGK